MTSLTLLPPLSPSLHFLYHLVLFTQTPPRWCEEPTIPATTCQYTAAQDNKAYFSKSDLRRLRQQTQYIGNICIGNLRYTKLNECPPYFQDLCLLVVNG